jgi:hypothetical protein
MSKTDLVVSPYYKGPAYRYIRASDRLPTYEEIFNISDPICKIKLFNPIGSWTWFLASYNADTKIAWGRVHGFEDEVGDIYMPKLIEVRGQFGLPIERDLHWTPRHLSECLQ